MPDQVPETAAAKMDRARRYDELSRLLRTWMNEEGDYDERVWPVLERELGLGNGRSQGDVPDDHEHSA